MTRNSRLGLTSVLLIFALSGCGTLGGIFGGGSEQQGVAISRVAPLVVPPDFSLAPVDSGARGQDNAAQQQVLDALYGGPAQRSATEAAITRSAGTADPGIRSTVGDPDTRTVNKGSTTRDIVAAPEGDGQNAQAVIPQ